MATGETTPTPTPIEEEIFRFLCDEGVVAITMPSPDFISPESKAAIEQQFGFIQRRMKGGVVEYARRLEELKQAGAGAAKQPEGLASLSDLAGK